MAKARRFAYVRSLLDSIAKVGYGDEDTVDEIVGACILIISNNHSEVTIDIVCLDLFCLLLKINSDGAIDFLGKIYRIWILWTGMDISFVF